MHCDSTHDLTQPDRQTLGLQSPSKQSLLHDFPIAQAPFSERPCIGSSLCKNTRLAEGLGGASAGHLLQTPAQARLPRDGWTLGTTGKGLASSSLHPLFAYLYIARRSPPSPLFSRTNSPSSLSLLVAEMLQSCTQEWLGCRSLDSLRSVRASPALGSPQLDPVLQVWPHHS